MYDIELLRKRVAYLLLDGSTLGEKRICGELGISRGTLGRIISGLEEVVLRTGKGYSLSDDIAVVVLSTCAREMRLRVYSPSRGIFEDTEIPFSSGFTYESNLAHALALTDKYLKGLRQKGYRAVSCFVYAENVSIPRSLPNIFRSVGSMETLAAKALGASLEGTCLYLSAQSFICNGGRPLTRSVTTPEDRYAFLESFLNCAIPDRVIIEDRYDEAIESLCRKKGVECSFLGGSDGLFAYERESIAACIASLAEN